MNHGLIPYIGGKHRIANRLAGYCRRTGCDLLVDVFGGSAAVTLACVRAGFVKRVYNDIDGDLVNLFRIISDRNQRRFLLNMLRWTPPSRAIFQADAVRYREGGFSFARVADPVERARATFYRHMFCFGGKTRCGGMSVSVNDRFQIKEIGRYRNSLRRMVRVGEMFRETMIEQKDYTDIVRIYGARPQTCLFVDPPYVGTENYYSRPFSKSDHVFLAQAIAGCRSAVVATYYDAPILRELYPAPEWTWTIETSTKNSSFLRGNKASVQECVITRPARP